MLAASLMYLVQIINKTGMETFNEDKLVSYELDDQVIKTGFGNYGEASQYAANKSGTLVEVAFTDGNDNPRITNEAGLIAQRKSLFIDAGPDYQFIHSDDPRFVEFSDQLQEMESDIKEESPEEKYITDQRIENTEDPLIILKNGQFDSVQSVERIKYRMHAKVYKIGVALDK